MAGLWDKLRALAYEPKVPYAPFGAGDRFEKYRAEEERLTLEFKRDLFAHYGVTDNPKADLAWELSWVHAPYDDKESPHMTLARFYGVLVLLFKD